MPLCERAYIGKTTQCLSERAKQHIPNKLLETPPVLWSAKTDSAISKHLKENPECISEDLRKNFSVLAQARSQAHLNVLEALFIQAKSPVLCSQVVYKSSVSPDEDWQKSFENLFFGRCP